MMRLLRPLLARAVCSAALMLLAAPWAMAQVTFNYTGNVQTYTVPAGIYAIQIHAYGAGGGGGGSDDANGGTGGRGMGIRAVYNVTPGAVLKIIVGGGGLGATGSVNCNASAGAGGPAGGAGGFAGGAGGRAGCTGFSGGGGGGGGATVVTTQTNVMMMIAGGGGGGQGGAAGLAGRDGLTANALSAAFGSAGAAGTGGVNGNVGGGGGGGGGCLGGAGGAINPGGAGPNTTTQAAGGQGCNSSTSLDASAGVSVLGTGGLGGAGGVGVAQPGAAGAAGSVVITYPTLTLAKSQPSPALAVGVNSVYTLTVTNTLVNGIKAYAARVLDQLPSNMTYVGSSGTGWSCSTTPNASGTLVTCNFTGTINSNNGTAVLQITARPTTPANVTNYAAVDPTGGIIPPDPATCTAANTPAGCAAPVFSLGPVTVSGYGYADLNHNSAREAGEVGPDASAGPQHVKLSTRTGSVCNFPALAAVTISATSGAYSFSNVARGDYCLTLQRNTLLTTNDPTRYVPGYIGTENPTGVIQFTVGSGGVPPLNFGLYRGSRMTGTVFADNGAGGGTANNGVRDGAEAGLAGTTVIVKQTSSDIEIDRTVTSGDGSFLLWQPSTFTEGGTIIPVLPAAYTATGGSPGTHLGGNYVRPRVLFTLLTGRIDSGIAFGMVGPNTLAPNGAQTAEPGTAVFYAHTYTAATGGQVTFTLAGAASPASPAWSQVLYRDSNCNATLAASEPIEVTTPVTVTAGQKVCLIVKQYVPAGAPLNAHNAVTLSAAFSYTNAAPALANSTLIATDITTVGDGGNLTLGKLVANETQNLVFDTSVPARPGDTLVYLLFATNKGAEPLSTLVVHDATPAYTSFVEASCFTPPAGMTCSVTQKPAVGATGGVQWTLTGPLAPGKVVQVTFRARLDQ